MKWHWFWAGIHEHVLYMLHVTHNNSWASRARYADWNAPISDVENVSPLQFVYFICIWIHFRNLFGRTHLYFICQIWNKFSTSTIGCQCFNFVYPKHDLCIQIDALAWILYVLNHDLQCVLDAMTRSGCNAEYMQFIQLGHMRSEHVSKWWRPQALRSCLHFSC